MKSGISTLAHWASVAVGALAMSSVAAPSFSASPAAPIFQVAGAEGRGVSVESEKSCSETRAFVVASGLYDQGVLLFRRKKFTGSYNTLNKGISALGYRYYRMDISGMEDTGLLELAAEDLFLHGHVRNAAHTVAEVLRERLDECREQSRPPPRS